MRLGVTATQEGLTRAQEKEATAFLRDAHRRGLSAFHHGGCVGGDKELHEIMVGHLCTEALVVMHRGSTPDKWAEFEPEDNDVVHEPKDNIERNHDIVTATDELLACPKERQEVIRSGTWATVRFAVKTGKPVTIIYLDGSIERR